MKIDTVSFCIIAYNEEKYLPNLLSNLLEQTYPKNKIEVILVDGLSNDCTKEIMNRFKNEKFDYMKIKVLDNLKRIQPTGWNVAIRAATNDVILRVDAHAELPVDFIEMNMKCINSGEYVCGGPRPNIIDDVSNWKKTLLIAEQSIFGSSIAPYRNSQGKKYVNSIFHGAYRREVFEKVGLFNENLIRTEDNELHYRVRIAGYKICYDPKIISYYHTRSTLKGMIKQKNSNGYWIGKTLLESPRCISLYHLIPLCFVMSLFMTFVLYLFGIKWLFVLLCSLYSMVCLLLMIISFVKEKVITNVFLPIIFFVLHSSYGVGTLFGITKSILKLKKK